jgi:5,10-methylenetetrahydrofolate reductase
MGETQTCAAHKNNKTKHNKMRSTELMEDRDEGDLRGCWESIHGLRELEGRRVVARTFVNNASALPIKPVCIIPMVF